MLASQLFSQIEQLVPTLDGWCIPEKACDFAAIILALRPSVSVEIGVFGGRGSLSMALAHRFIGKGTVIAIDPWSARASVAGQTGKNAEWWADQERHNLVYQRFLAQIEKLGLKDWIDVKKLRSDQVEPPDNLGFVIVDGNHGIQAVTDVQRFAPKVARGGIIYLDDLHWDGGGVQRAAEELERGGFRRLFDRDQGAFFQRRD